MWTLIMKMACDAESLGFDAKNGEVRKGLNGILTNFLTSIQSNNKATSVMGKPKFYEGFPTIDSLCDKVLSKDSLSV